MRRSRPPGPMYRQRQDFTKASCDMILSVVPFFSLPQPRTLEIALHYAGSGSNTSNIGFQVGPLVFSLHTVETLLDTRAREDRSGSRQADGTNLFAGQAFKFVSELLGFRVIGCPTYSPGKHAIRREFFCESSRIDTLPRRCTRNCCSIRLTSMPGTLYDPPGTKKKKKSSPSWSVR